VTTLKPTEALRLDLPAGMLVGAETVAEQEVPVLTAADAPVIETSGDKLGAKLAAAQFGI
jgi:hypothetical protein